MSFIKKILCSDIRKTALFYSAVKNDVQYIKDNIKLAKQTERRATDYENSVYHGFAAIHYAIVKGNYESFQMLLNEEFNMTTKAEIDLHLPQLADGIKFRFPIKQDILNLAIIMNDYTIAKEIVQANIKGTSSLLGETDDNHNTHLMMMAHFNVNENMKDFFLNTPINKEFTVMPNGFSYTREVFYYKRIDHMLMLLELLENNVAFMEPFYFQLTACVSNENMFTVVSKEVNYKGYQTSKENQDIMLQFLQRIMPQAVRQLQQHMSQYKGHLAVFYKHSIDYKIDSHAKTMTIKEMQVYLKELAGITPKTDKIEKQNDSIEEKIEPNKNKETIADSKGEEENEEEEEDEEDDSEK